MVDSRCSHDCYLHGDGITLMWREIGPEDVGSYPRPSRCMVASWRYLARIPPHWHASSPISVRPPDCPISKVLLLPDLYFLFDPFQAFFACPPASLAVRGTDRDQDALLAYIDLA